MISSVSNVNFRGDVAPVNHQDLINSPGKFTTQAPKADAPADSFEKKDGADNAETKKSKAPAIIGSVAALLLAAYVGLSVAVGKGKIVEKQVAEGAEKLKFGEKVNNFFYKIGKSGENLWNKIRGKKTEDVADNKKAPDTPKSDATDSKKPGTPDAEKPNTQEQPKTGGSETNKQENKQEGNSENK